MQERLSLSAFEEMTRAAGLGEMDADDLTLLMTLWEGAAKMVAILPDVVTHDDEPATTFVPGWIDVRAARTERTDRR